MKPVPGKRTETEDGSQPRRGRPWVKAAIGFTFAGVLYLGLPAVAGMSDTAERLREGDPTWLALGVASELLSYAAYVLLFRGIFDSRSVRIDWRRSARITLAGVVATRLFAAGGAGGVVLTAWALRRSGMSRGEVAERMTAFMVLLYGVFMAALIVGGLGLHTGAFPGPSPLALTAVPAALGAAVVAIALVAGAVPPDLTRRLPPWAGWPGRAASHVGAGVRGALRRIGGRDPRLLGAIAWWGFDIAVLWTSFRAFGDSPPVAVLTMSYFVGMLANTLPLPGGVGGVEGGMIGAFIGFDVDASLAIIAVLSYRAIAFWLPILPGALAYLQLRREFGHDHSMRPPPLRRRA